MPEVWEQDGNIVNQGHKSTPWIKWEQTPQDHKWEHASI